MESIDALGKAKERVTKRNPEYSFTDVQACI
jgi:hypothetical protein